MISVSSRRKRKRISVAAEMNEDERLNAVMLKRRFRTPMLGAAVDEPMIQTLEAQIPSLITT
jgi:hypothetical protein